MSKTIHSTFLNFVHKFSSKLKNCYPPPPAHVVKKKKCRYIANLY